MKIALGTLLLELVILINFCAGSDENQREDQPFRQRKGLAIKNKSVRVPKIKTMPRQIQETAPSSSDPEREAKKREYLKLWPPRLNGIITHPWDQEEAGKTRHNPAVLESHEPTEVELVESGRPPVSAWAIHAYIVIATGNICSRFTEYNKELFNVYSSGFQPNPKWNNGIRDIFANHELKVAVIETLRPVLLIDGKKGALYDERTGLTNEARGWMVDRVNKIIYERLGHPPPDSDRDIIWKK